MQESHSAQSKADARDQFIPIRKSDIIAALTKSGLLEDGEQHEKFL
jgi:hypothetical protein